MTGGRQLTQSCPGATQTTIMQTRILRLIRISAVVLTTAVLVSARAGAADETNDPIAMIREEGMNHSQVMETLSYLSDVIGPRLTGSTNLKRANEWTMHKLQSWGLTNAHLEAWGPFGRGWELQRFSAQIIEPQDIPLKAYPNAWTPGFDQPFEAEVVLIDTTNSADWPKYEGKLQGKIVLPSPPREVFMSSNAPVHRLDEKDLLELADAPEPPARGFAGFGGFGGAGGTGLQRPDGTNRPGDGSSTNRFRRGRFGGTNGFAGGGTNGFPRGTNAFSRFRRRGPNLTRELPFLIKEGAVMVAIPGSGDTGLFVVQSAILPPAESGTNTATNSDTFGPGFGPRGGPAYATNAVKIPAEITVAVEDYNRMARMIQQGEKLKMAVDLRVKFETDDLMAYNTVAEIPGTDLKKQVVMLGGHLDSWHGATGATDNGAGVAASMEAVRIIKAVGLKPRRTIRVALWSGEEEGLFGSKAYVSNHFGYYPSTTNSRAGRRARTGGGDGDQAPARERRPKLVKKSEYEQLSVYFNLDNGVGKIRGVYMQGNEAARPYFQKWLAPFRDLGAETITPSNTGSTDHVSFDAVGLPGFQFIQDPMDYDVHTHHTTEDVFDRIPPEDMKQCSTILAAFVYEAAMLDEKFPRKEEKD